MQIGSLTQQFLQGPLLHQKATSKQSRQILTTFQGPGLPSYPKYFLSRTGKTNLGTVEHCAKNQVFLRVCAMASAHIQVELAETDGNCRSYLRPDDTPSLPSLLQRICSNAALPCIARVRALRVSLQLAMGYRSRQQKSRRPASLPKEGTTGFEASICLALPLSMKSLFPVP